MVPLGRELGAREVLLLSARPAHDRRCLRRVDRSTGGVELAMARPAGHGDLGRRRGSRGCAALELGSAPGRTRPRAGLHWLRHDEPSPGRVRRSALLRIGSIHTSRCHGYDRAPPPLRQRRRTTRGRQSALPLCLCDISNGACCHHGIPHHQPLDSRSSHLCRTPERGQKERPRRSPLAPGPFTVWRIGYWLSAATSTTSEVPVQTT